MVNLLLRNSIVSLLCFIALLTSCTKKPTGSITVTTKVVTEITENSAKCGGSVSFSGGFTITDCGICYGKSPSPTISDGYTEDHYGEGSFNSVLSNLDSDTKYYVRAYAKTSSGIKYGNQEFFTTPYVTPDPPTGAIKGLFSVSNTQRVWFSKGNLQYQASTNTWRFAEKQWDYVGTHKDFYHNGGTVSGSDNMDISSTYHGWIDLFGWGTSGYNHGANCYQPWNTSEDWNDYHVYSDASYNLYDKTGKADWGYNPIINGGNTLNTWRTLTKEEWLYLFNTRNTASGIRYAKAKVANCNGVIILPDNWSNEYYSLNTSTSAENYDSNTISASQWPILEQYGAIFLPAGGMRGLDVYIDNAGTWGEYWASSVFYEGNHLNKRLACILSFSSQKTEPKDHGNRNYGRSVRLVRNY